MRSNRWQTLACFADTGFFYALTDSGDRWYPDAAALLRQIQRQGRFLVSSPLVVAETYTLIRYRIGYAVAIEWLTNLRSWVEIVPLTENDEEKAIFILKQYDNQAFTLADAVSFAIIEALGIPIALSTDKHFTVYRGNFIVVPIVGQLVPEP